MNETNEFSFKLGATDHGIGVFALGSIPKGTYLRLFGDRNSEGELQDRARVLPRECVPEELKGFCVFRDTHFICPPDFGEMAIGWYLNHSLDPNAVRDGRYRWFAARDIAKGDEITINYNSLEEPQSMREGFYQE